jgi:hypothetical protein
MRYRNAMQRDPNLAKAFDNLAGLFAPPSGSDYLASAKMQSERAEAARLAEIYNYAKDPSFNRELFDRKLVAAGRATPNQSFYSVDQGNLTSRNNNAADNTRQLEQTRLQETGQTTRTLLAPVPKDATRFNPPSVQEFFKVDPTQIGVVAAAPGERNFLPGGGVLDGTPKPETMDEAKARVFREMPQNQQRAITFGPTPVEQVIMGDRTTNVTRPESLGQAPVDTTAPTRTDNFQAMGADGKSFNFLGYTRNGPNGVEVINQATGQVQPNVIRREGTQGGMSFESDGKGGIKLSTGNAAGQPTGRVNDLMRAESEGNRAVNELIPLFGNLREDDLGARGAVNDLMTNYGAQVAPGMARPDVAGRRNQLRATTLSLAKALLGDDRLSDADRRAAEAVSVSNGIDESLPGARAKIASLIVLNAYRASYAKSVREGQQLPPLSPQIVGQMVDNKVIPAEIARQYVQNNFNAQPQTGGPVSGVQVPPGLPGAPQAAAPTAQGDPLAEARAAIARGAPRDAVIQRLQGLGVNPEGL